MSTNNQLKIKRKSYFVLAAIRQMGELKTSKLSARSVAFDAGFNTSSIYTYFKSMDHLESLACISFTKPYLQDLSKTFKRCHSWLEKYVSMWEVFLNYTFKNPQQFIRVFYPSSDKEWTLNLYAEYFEMFPDENIFDDVNNSSFFIIDSTRGGYHRDEYLIKKCIEEGSVVTDNWDYIIETNIAFTYYTVCDIMNTAPKPPENALYYKCLRYIILSMYHYVSDEQRPFLAGKLEEYTLLAK